MAIKTLIIRNKGKDPKKAKAISDGLKRSPKRQNSLNNLRPPWQPGQSGNPNGPGRPKGSGTKLISAAYTAYLQQCIPEDDCINLGIEKDAGITWSDMIAIQTMRRSIGLVNHDKICFDAIIELREVTEGKIPDRSELTGKDGSPLQSPPPPIFNIRFKDSPNSKESKQENKNATGNDAIEV